MASSEDRPEREGASPRAEWHGSFGMGRARWCSDSDSRSRQNPMPPGNRVCRLIGCGTETLLRIEAASVMPGAGAPKCPSGDLRLCYAVWDRRCSGGWESRETAALRLGTPHAVGDRPRRTGTGGIRICRDGDSGEKRRTQDRGFAKSEHMTPSSVSSALVEWTLHAPLIIPPGSNKLFYIAQ